MVSRNVADVSDDQTNVSDFDYQYEQRLVEEILPSRWTSSLKRHCLACMRIFSDSGMGQASSTSRARSTGKARPQPPSSLAEEEMPRCAAKRPKRPSASVVGGQHKIRSREKCKLIRHQPANSAAAGSPPMSYMPCARPCVEQADTGSSAETCDAKADSGLQWRTFCQHGRTGMELAPERVGEHPSERLWRRVTEQRRGAHVRLEVIPAVAIGGQQQSQQVTVRSRVL